MTPRDETNDYGIDYGPDPACSLCKGTGEAPNPHFLCSCRWIERGALLCENCEFLHAKLVKQWRARVAAQPSDDGRWSAVAEAIDRCANELEASGAVPKEQL